MAKTIIYRPRMSNKDIRNKIKFFYTEKFFNLWMNKFIFEGLNYQQVNYIMKKLWSTGSVACSSVKSADKALAGLIDSGEVDMGENELIFTPWTFAKRYNIYDYPTHVRLINTRAVKFITNRELELDKEVVVIFAQKNHKSVFSSIEAKLNEIVDIEMKKRLARKAQAQPWMFTFSPEDVEQAKVLEQQLEDDAPYMFVPFQDVDKVKGITSGAPYIVDKFEQDRQKAENDVLTMLGVNNVGVGEKKEHLVVDEINANNEDVEQRSISFKSELEEAFDRVNSIFNKSISIIDINEIMKEAYDEVEEKEDSGYNEEGGEKDA